MFFSSFRRCVCALVVLSSLTLHLAAAHSYDISAGWIQRLPTLSYVWESENPTVEGWPEVGENVTWRAYVKNWHSEAFTDVVYTWTLDGVVVTTGTVNLPPQTHTPVDFPWTWTFDRHELTFVINADHAIDEYSTRNNRISLYTDALSVGLWVEQSLYDYFHANQYKLAVGANGWEDWAQRQVTRWNEMFATAIYPLDTPEGVLDRLRVDQINIVPDGTLPISGGLPSNRPDSTNRTVDLQWGFPFTEGHSSFYGNHTSRDDNNPFYYEGSLIHELGHARYLIDTYGFNYHDNDPRGTDPWSNVTVQVDGEVIVATPYMPLNPPWWDSIFFPNVPGGPGYGLMAGPYTLVDQHSAAALNLIAGHRATVGNWNSPGNIGIYLQDLPQENIVTVRDSFGNIMPYATVTVYRTTARAGNWYGKRTENTPDMVVVANAQGEAPLGRCPFAADGVIRHTFGIANGVMMVRVDHEERIGFGFMDVMHFNLQYWRGNTETGRYDLAVSMLPDTFDIAGTRPHNGHVTPLNSISRMEVIVSGPPAQNVRINGAVASYDRGAWRRNNVALTTGTNTFTVVATRPDAAVTQTVVYVRHDDTPPMVGVDALLVPSPGEHLMVNDSLQIRWQPHRFRDDADGTNVRIDTIDLVDAETGDFKETIAQNRGNNGSFSWTPQHMYGTTPVALRFTVSDQSGNTSTRTYNHDAFYVIPEPVALVPLGLIFVLWRRRARAA